MSVSILLLKDEKTHLSIWHVNHAIVPFGTTHMRQTNASVAGGPLDHRSTRFQSSLRRCDSVSSGSGNLDTDLLAAFLCSLY